MATAFPSLSPLNSLSSVEGGYPTGIFFGSFDAKYVCNFCSRILRDPVQSFCGHRFCRSCVRAIVSSGKRVQCQMCLNEGVMDEYSFLHGDQLFPDNALRREMSNIQVKCFHRECEWTGIFKELERHLTDSNCRPVTCGQCGCSVPFKQASTHETNCPKRKTNCKHCKLEITTGEVETHSKVCLQHPLKCDACGKKKIPREKMQDHLRTECSNANMQCPVDGQWVHKDKFQKHFTDNADHMIWMMQELRECQRLMSMPSTQTDHITSKLQAVESKYVGLEQQVSAIATHVNGSVGQSFVTSDGITAALQGTIKTVDNRCHSLEIKTGTFEGVTGTLHREIDRIITAVETMERERRVAKDMIEDGKRKIDALERTVAVKDIALTELNLRLQALEFTNYTGELIWKITEFSKKQEEASRGRNISIYSPVFYTSREGYKMCARLYPNGDGIGKGTHVSLFFVVMRGHYDALMQWPFQQRVTFILVDQKGGQHIVDSFRPDPASTSFKRPTSDMNIASGCPLFLPLSRLDERHTAFVKDDEMFIKIVVDTTENSQPVVTFP